MKNHQSITRIQTLRLLALLMPMMSACEMVMKAKEPVTVTTTTTTSNSSTVYDCTSYAVVSEYNTKLDCETATNANCSSKYVTFPNKLSATCFVPPVGWAACVGNTYNWIYTLPTLSSAYFDSSSSSLQYGLKKSLIGCESRKCKCTSPTVEPSQSMDTFISSSDSAAPDLNSCGITNCGNYIYNGSLNIDFPLTTLKQSFNLSVPTSVSVLNPIPGGPNVLVSESISPTATLTNAPPGFVVTVYQDAICTSTMGASSTSTIDSSGNASLSSLALSATKYGKILFYVKFSKGTVTSQCLDTGAYFYRVKTPEMRSSGSLIFPNKMALTGQLSTIVFSASEPAGVVYSCKADQTPDDTATGDCTSSLPGVVSFDPNTGIFQWTPNPSAYGLYEVCVTGTQQATLAPPTSPTGKKCSVVQVISSNLVTNRLVRYYDAEFSDPSTHGHTLNSSSSKASWLDLIGGTSAILNTSSSRGFRFSNDSGWTESGAHALSMNRGTWSNPDGSWNHQPHLDFVDTGGITNELGSFSIDMWVNMTNPPIRIGNCLLGSCKIYETGYGVIAQIVEPGSTTDSVRNGIQLFANYDNTVLDKFKFSISLKHAGITTETWKPDATDAITYDFSTWYHVTISWRKSTGRLYFYVNGEYIGDKNWSSVDFLPVKAREVRLGASWKLDGIESDNVFSGKIANFRFYNGEDTTIPISNCSSERNRFSVSPSSDCP
jgi:hypothetical protein